MLNHTEARRHLHNIVNRANDALAALADGQLDEALEEVRAIDRDVLVEIEANLALEVEETALCRCGGGCPECSPRDAAEYR